MVVGPGTVGFVVYKGPDTPNFFWRCFDGVQFSSIGEIAEEVHILQAGQLSSVTVTYHVEGALGASGTCTALVKVYSGNPGDSVSPPDGLLASYTVPSLPWSTATNHTFTYDIPSPPNGGMLDASKVNVLFTPRGGEREVVGQSPNGSCSDGWQYSPNREQVLLCGPTCDRVRASNGQLSLEFGCTTQVIF